jgi:sugar phosphate isomerase/epimerase
MPNKLAVQMYTLRDFTGTAEGFEAALDTIHGIGYAGVQLSAVGCMNGETPEVTAERAREMLDANGLKCVATHRPLKSLIEQTDAEIEFHRTLGCDYAAIGGIFEYGDTPEAFRRFLADAAPMIARLKEAGIRFGFHNHAHEFIRNPETGRACYDILIDEAPDLYLEIDTYWVQHAGVDPANLLERASGRISVIHVKDKEVVSKDGPVMAPVGEGNLDWDRIIPVCEAGGTEWYVVEQDECRRDPFDCLASSFEYLSRKGLA